MQLHKCIKEMCRLFMQSADEKFQKVKKINKEDLQHLAELIRVNIRHNTNNHFGHVRQNSMLHYKIS